MIKKILALLIVACTLFAVLAAGCSTSKTQTSEQPLVVTRGDLNITVSTNGKLSMPDDYSLRFGTTGKVKEILVEEGDIVKQGTLLAFLDSTTQKNAIRTALYNLRTAIYATSTDSSCDPFYNFTYPDLSAPRMAEEAEGYLSSFVSNYKQGLYKEAGSDLAMAYLSLEVCEDLIKEKNDPDVISGKKDDPVYFPDTTAGTEDRNEGTNKEDHSKYDKALAYLKSYKAKLLAISKLVMEGKIEQVKLDVDNALLEMVTVNALVSNTVDLRGWDYFTFSDVPTSLNFLQASIRSLREANKYSEESDASTDKISQKLYMTKLNLSIGRDVLENQRITFWGYFGWKKLQTYNLAVQSSEIALQKAIRDIRNTVIVAPSDGTVVSVDLKKDYVLSAQDYSSKTAVEIVDTKTIEFTGTVDEIDILKVKKGQTAKITVDALTGKEFTGKVKFISPYGEKDGNVVKFAITIEINPTNVDLRGNLSASADIDVYSVQNVLLVPVSVLNYSNGAYTATVINASGQTEVKKVTIGQKSFQYAEVLSGLNEGDKLTVAVQTPTAKTNAFGGPPPGGP